MVDYTKSKIYKIVCNVSGKAYVGSTCQARLSDRLGQHRYAHIHNTKKGGKSSVVMEHGDFYIVLLESFPCKSKDELSARERYWIEKEPCVNKQIPGRTQKDWIKLRSTDPIISVKRKEYMREYRRKRQELKKQEKEKSSEEASI